jgi:hypothetical protein
MANSLQDREERLQLGYRELEETNKELQDSYERQEKISAELGRFRRAAHPAPRPGLLAGRGDTVDA